MQAPFRRVVLIALLMLAGAFARAQAQAPYQGIYVIIDPYNTTHVALLQSAAQTPCPSTATPFCGAASGILLRVNWCDYQLYHKKNAAGTPYPSCHYTVGYSDGVGSTGTELPVTDTISPCTGTYDTCTGKTQGVLAGTLSLIAQINTLRASAGLPALQLSVGLAAGDFTPQTVIDTVGYVDLPHNASQTADPGQEQCIRLPLVWKAKYVSNYEASIDSLLATIDGYFPQGSNIQVLKASGIGGTSLEIEMPGQTNVITAPVDPGPGGPGAALACSTTSSGAQTWLAAYNKSAIKGDTFAQAVESTFGTLIGHEYGALANAGLPNALLSIPTTNGTALSMVNCGTTAASKCKTQGGTGPWGVYYFQKYVDDLFTGGLSETAAAAAYAAIRSDTYNLPPAQLAVNWTGLQPAPIASASQTECNTNNTVPAYEPIFTMSGTAVPMLGVGTSLGWQTLFNSAGQCSDGSFATTLGNGLNDGGLFIEIETDTAFTSISSCAQYLAPALSTIQAVVPPTQCQYQSQ